MTSSEPTLQPQEASSDKVTLARTVRQTCHRLQNQLLHGESQSATAKSRATLAELRHAAGKDLSKNPLGLEQVLFVLDPPLPAAYLGKGDNPSPSESAAAVAMTFFALHMQSPRGPAHDGEVSFGRACGKLHALNLSGSIKPRIDAMLLAHTEAARLVHIRGLITMLRGNGIAFDYGRFAEDLRSLNNPEKRAGVQLRWGRDFVYGTYS